MLSAVDQPGSGKAPATRRIPRIPVLDFIDTSFENASPLWYEQAPDGSIDLHLIYDHERESPNRASGHVHFLIQAQPGTKLTFEFRNLENVWNGGPSLYGRYFRSVLVSEDGRSWRGVSLDNLPDDRVRLHLTMPGPQLYVARLEPYRVSDLDRFLASVCGHPLVKIMPIGRTVLGRGLEILRIGNLHAPYRVFIRARAHPWEPVGNWVLQGLVRRLLANDADARRFLERYCVYAMPMANKDGVALGRTRFNALGSDLNRGWDRPIDARSAPENAALERWLEGMIASGRKPHLALELHNDHQQGQLHLSAPSVPDLTRYRDRMAVLERLLRQHTWFTDGSTSTSFRNPGTLGDGWLERFGIDGVVHEFASNWIAGVKDFTSGRHWEDYGANLAEVLYEYLGAVQP
ncbi:MAG: peptidase M14 [Opitutaceae bacterium]|nr:peptidase M14 [Opitutaceae bacterium]